MGDGIPGYDIPPGDVQNEFHPVVINMAGTDYLVCDYCHTVFCFKESHDTSNLPDGVFPGDGGWICDECMRDAEGNLLPRFK